MGVITVVAPASIHVRIHVCVGVVGTPTVGGSGAFGLGVYLSAEWLLWGELRVQPPNLSRGGDETGGPG